MTPSTQPVVSMPTSITPIKDPRRLHWGPRSRQCSRRRVNRGTAVRKHLASQFVAAPADDAFALITTPDRLPEWNSAIIRVVDAPDALSPDAEWVVQLSALGQSWPSRSTVVDIDPQARHFAYRSRTDDGNPSY